MKTSIVVVLIAIALALSETSAAIGISIPVMTARAGDTLDIPVMTTTLPASSVLAYQFEMVYSSSAITVLSVTTEGTLTGQAGWGVTTNIRTDTVAVGAFGTDFLSGSGPIIRIRCRVKGPVGNGTTLGLRQFLFNAGSPAVTVTGGGVTTVTSTPEGEQRWPAATALLQNYPNPFNPATTIPYVLGNGTDVHVAVYSPLGQEVRTLVHQHQDAGTYRADFDGAGLPSGVYIVCLRAGATTLSRPMLLLK